MSKAFPRWFVYTDKAVFGHSLIEAKSENAIYKHLGSMTWRSFALPHIEACEAQIRSGFLRELTESEALEILNKEKGGS